MQADAAAAAARRAAAAAAEQAAGAAAAARAAVEAVRRAEALLAEALGARGELVSWWGHVGPGAREVGVAKEVAVVKRGRYCSATQRTGGC